MIEQIVVDVLSNGTSIVFDFPANTISQRTWLVGLAEQASAVHELHYIVLFDSICKTLLLKQAAEKPERDSTDTVEMVEAISKYFKLIQNQL